MAVWLAVVIRDGTFAVCCPHFVHGYITLVPPLLVLPAAAEMLVAAVVAQWQKPIDTLSKAGRAFDVSSNCDMGGHELVAPHHYLWDVVTPSLPMWLAFALC